MEIKAIITGSTGMVGEGVLHECLQHPDVTAVLVINRKPCGVTHPKLKEIIHKDFFDMLPIAAQLHDYNACYFCLGVSSIGMKEPEYTRFTYDLTMEVAKTLQTLNPEMTFCYVSGAGTDSTEQGRSMWARVKGRTENALLNMPFKAAYMFRPGFINPGKDLKNTHGFYKFISWMYPFFKRVTPNYVITLSEIGLAMINVTKNGYPKHILEVPDIAKAAQSI
ncbi:epimerase [Chitinophaga silvatica]|uniref:Epimerase n=1 Tax=Chitinophaga silvatica TaxID=2282649 RepID=A0A3E1Y4R8_9BACT|nr:epimerase [Chitinophaga silvatica]RFS19671.1 epimerase [Chitinophaga silvatica]